VVVETHDLPFDGKNPGSPDRRFACCPTRTKLRASGRLESDDVAFDPGWFSIIAIHWGSFGFELLKNEHVTRIVLTTPQKILLQQAEID